MRKCIRAAGEGEILSAAGQCFHKLKHAHSSAGERQSACSVLLQYLRQLLWDRGQLARLGKHFWPSLLRVTGCLAEAARPRFKKELKKRKTALEDYSTSGMSQAL